MTDATTTESAPKPAATKVPGSVKLRGTQVLVRMDERKSMILRPTNTGAAKADNTRYVFTVVAIGPGAVTDDGMQLPIPDLRVGDEVLVHPQFWAAAMPVKIDGVEHVILQERMIYAAYLGDVQVAFD